MADHVNAGKRSAIMASVKSKDTGPELTLRKALYAVGYRYRLFGKGLPGRPDVVFAGRKKVVFVHGCFWHGHDCRKGNLPKSRTDYWGEKISRNKERDARNLKDLRDAGWEVGVVWECELKDMTGVLERLRRFLGPPRIR